MERKVFIGKREMRLRSSLFTIIAYKSEFGTDLFQDVSKMEVKKDKSKNVDISNVVQTLFQIIYLLNKPFSQRPFEDFLSDFDFDVLTDSDSLTSAMKIVGEMLGSTMNGSGKKSQTPSKSPKPHTYK